MLADFLWLCSPTNVAYKFVHGPAIQRTRDPNIEGAGGARYVKARVTVFKTLWKDFYLVSFIITEIIK